MHTGNCKYESGKFATHISNLSQLKKKKTNLCDNCEILAYIYVYVLF